MSGSGVGPSGSGVGPSGSGVGPSPVSVPTAHIYDRGYRKYDGERTGVVGAVKTLVSHSAAHALGLRRSAKYKVVPVLIIVAAYLPAAVFIGIAALVPQEDLQEAFLPTYAGYYGYVIAAIYLLAGFITPELLAPDRRTGMLGVYLASPLNRVTYLVGKAIAVVLLLLIVTFGPPLLMLIAFSLENSGPDGFVEWIKVFGQILAGSAAMGVIFASIGLAISASTDRVVVATATILAVLPASAIATDVLVASPTFPTCRERSSTASTESRVCGVRPTIRLGRCTWPEWRGS